MTQEEIYARMPQGVIGVEDFMRGDFIAYYLDEETWQHYSRMGYPIDIDEMCRPTIWWGEVYRVEQIRDGEWPFDYHYKILSVRPDVEWPKKN